MERKKGRRDDLAPWGQALLTGKPPMEHKKRRRASRAPKRQALLKVMGHMKGRREGLAMPGDGIALPQWPTTCGEGRERKGNARHLAKTERRTGIGLETGTEDIVTENTE